MIFWNLILTIRGDVPKNFDEDLKKALQQILEPYIFIQHYLDVEVLYHRLILIPILKQKYSLKDQIVFHMQDHRGV
uniref:Condensation domain-containing protein n=1 Tax=Acrobeloides nanus TaxID=290746 RepID=A0A914C8K3_9BILA